MFKLKGDRQFEIRNDKDFKALQKIEAMGVDIKSKEFKAGFAFGLEHAARGLKCLAKT